jgi:hypothetical protein
MFLPQISSKQVYIYFFSNYSFENLWYCVVKLLKIVFSFAYRLFSVCVTLENLNLWMCNINPKDCKTLKTLLFFFNKKITNIEFMILVVKFFLFSFIWTCETNPIVNFTGHYSLNLNFLIFLKMWIIMQCISKACNTNSSKRKCVTCIGQMIDEWRRKTLGKCSRIQTRVFPSTYILVHTHLKN